MRGPARGRLCKHAPLFVMGALGAIVTYVVYKTAWISDDAIITFRYVSNLRHGYGAVFNVGERVQGYTHPLWFALLCVGSVVTSDETFAAMGLSLAFTFATIVCLGAFLAGAARTRTAGSLIAALFAVLLATSDSWRAFQTSGLEGPLSSLLVVLFVVSVLDERAFRPWKVLLGGALLALCRPDFALLVTPAGFVALMVAGRERRLREAAVALLPLSGFVFARVYYGEFLPNTGHAKLGIYTFEQGVHQGLLYVTDWFVNEPVTVLASGALLIFGAARVRRRPEGALCLGLVVYSVYLVVIGGDFMRGRLLMPILVGYSAFGGLALARHLDVAWTLPKSAAAAAMVAAVGALAVTTAPEQTRMLSNSGIINERMYWLPEHSLATYAETRVLTHNPEFDLVAAYIKACGDVTIHSRTPAALGYYLGPQLSVIDTLGLTDRTIALLPRSHLRAPPPRPGHPYKRIPIAYLARRGDVSLFDDWQDKMRELDCSMRERVRAFENDPGLFKP